MSFANLGLDEALLRAVSDAGYERPTPIQERAIIPALDGRDLLGCAQTGTGKTAAFTLPILQLLDEGADDEPALRALIITPTRELAAQIGDSIETYGKHLDLWHTVIFGGVSDKKQIRELKRGVDVLVATPGRLLDLMGQGYIDLSTIEFFVLDEADRMLDMGFLPDVRRVVKALPTKRQTLFFSATMPPEIRELANTLLHDPVSIAVDPVSTPAERIEQRLYFVDKGNKRRLLVDLLNDEATGRTLVFSRTKHGANRIVKILDRAGMSAAAIHGNKSQGARTRALDGFRNGGVRILVATDIAARGIDVEGIEHGINFDLPNVPETYVHRIGRTARAGAEGIALSMCDLEEREYLVDIERLMGRHLDRVDEHPHRATEPPPAMTPLSGPKPRSASGSNGRNGNRRPSGGRRSGSRGRRNNGPSNGRANGASGRSSDRSGGRSSGRAGGRSSGRSGSRSSGRSNEA